jgi:hypothetical protein
MNGNRAYDLPNYPRYRLAHWIGGSRGGFGQPDGGDHVNSMSNLAAMRADMPSAIRSSFRART